MAAKALSNQMTRTVRVDRKKLIDVLKANREKHIAVFKEAMAGYKVAALAKIEEAFSGLDKRIAEQKSKIVEKISSFSPETASEFSNWLVLVEQVSVNLTVPVSYADAYDAAIDMAEFDTRDELELTGAEFQCFCRDVWDWTPEFTMANIRYTSAGK